MRNRRENYEYIIHDVFQWLFSIISKSQRSTALLLWFKILSFLLYHTHIGTHISFNNRRYITRSNKTNSVPMLKTDEQI